MGTKKLAFAAVAVLALSLAGAAQLRADDISYTYQFGGNTFEWQLPVNPTPDAVYPDAFEFFNLSFTENGAPLVGNLAFFDSISGGGFQLWDGSFDYVAFYYCNAFGAQLFTGPESAPTLISGNFTFIDYGNSDDPNGFTTGNPLGATSVPEPSVMLLLATGLAFGLALFALKKN